MKEQKHYKKQFNQSIIWYTASSIISQGLLTAHHFYIRKTTSDVFHGTFGCFISLFYFLIIFFNLGLNNTLLSFFDSFTNSKSNFIKFIKNQLLTQLGLLTTITTILLYYLKTNNLASNSIALLISLSFLCESIRTIISSFLKLAFYYRITSISETISMFIYLTYTWVNIIYSLSVSNKINYINIDFYLWTGFLLTSIIQIIILSTAFIDYYFKLPKNENNNTINKLEYPSFNRVIKSRISNTAVQISTQLFSGNFLVPACGYYISLEAASILKIISGFTTWITIVFQKILGTSAAAVFAHIKNYNFKKKTAIFNQLNTHLLHIMIGLVLFVTINYSFLFNIKTDNYLKTFTSFNFIILAIIITILEHFFVLYQKWFVLEEKAYYLLFANMINIAISITLLSYYNLTPTLSLLIILTLRIIMFIIISILAYKKWQIKPSLNINYKAILLLLTASLLFYILNIIS